MMQSLQPDILIARSQHKSLKRLVADAFRRRDRVAPFLSAEVRRAALCDDAALPDDVVALHREVSFQLDRSPPTPYRILVFPADFNDPETQINILSPLGVALLGLRRGDRMPVFLPEEGFHTLRVIGVRRKPNPRQ
ncbi:MAG TPA: GreA/GreB family elongation factor [Rhizomicrobium sp.]|jgi:transcription elongation GreA/GreB family factor|nr:GreA/GreB family elongation factor [Rhizomicrobium sp.]